MALYKDTFVAKGSELEAAIAKGPDEAKKVYDETTRRYEAQYSQADRDWFWTHQKDAIATYKRTKGSAQ
jgi:hypothetical protein